LSAGNYAISVKDFRNCLGSINVIIALNPIVVTAFATDAGSCESTNGSIQLFRTGGIGPYTYSIDGNTYQAGTTFTGLIPGTYDGFVKDSKTCIGFISGIVVGPSCNTKGSNGVSAIPAANVKSNAVKVAGNSVLKISAYPNPANTVFTLMLSGDSKEKVAITVTDLLGRKVYQAEGNVSLQYKFGYNFMPGIYLLQVVQGNEKQSLKLIKE
jgi:hypothetical protein